MNKDLLKKEIATLLETINEQFMLIHQHQGKIPQIELDIMLNNVRSLYERLQQLNKANDRNDITSPKIDASKLTGSDLITAAVSNVKNEIKAESVKQEIIHANDEVNVDEKIIVAAAQQIVEEKPVEKPAPEKPKTVEEKKEAVKANFQEQAAIIAAEEEEKKNPKPKKPVGGLFDAVPTIGEQFAEKPSVKDKLSTSKTEKSVVDKLHGNKISDLKTAIGINEKFRFANDLFEGNMQPYTETIERLNQANDLNHALQMIDSLITKYDWQKESESYKKLIDLIERRFL